MEFKWAIERLDCYPAAGPRENVVRTLHWRLSATSPAGTVSTTYGSIELEGPFLAADTPFKPFAELTEEDVIEWATARLDVGILKNALTMEIENRERPAMVTPPLPWAPPPQVVVVTPAADTSVS